MNGRGGLFTIVLVAAITLIGLGLRAERLRGPEGALGDDASRLALASKGILSTGVPTMPSGRVYLRGLVNSYSIAASFALFGTHDWSARLPSVVAGTLLIPLLFVFGAYVSGRNGGLAVASLAAFQPELIAWSANAWITMPFVTVFVASAYFLCRGYADSDRRRLRIGALLAVLTVLTHELGALLPLLFATVVGVGALRGRPRSESMPDVLTMGLLLLTLGLFATLGFYLRAGTVAGATGEFRHYWGPSLSADRFAADFANLSRYWPLLGAAAIGLMSVRSWKPPALFLYTAIATVAFTVWIIIDKSSEKYGLVLIPLLAVAAAWAVAQSAKKHSAIVIVLVFAVACWRDVTHAFVRPSPPISTWLMALGTAVPGPADLVLSDDPTIPAHYLGRADIWTRTKAFERYSFERDGQLTDMYTGAVVVRTLDELLLQVGSAPRTLWFIGRDGKFDDLPPGLADLLTHAATFRNVSGDGRLVLKVPSDALKR